MPRYEIEVKAFITVIVHADDAGEARERADRFGEWLSAAIGEGVDNSADHEPIDTDTGPFGIDGESCVDETDV